MVPIDRSDDISMTTWSFEGLTVLELADIDVEYMDIAPAHT